MTGQEKEKLPKERKAAAYKMKNTKISLKTYIIFFSFHGRRLRSWDIGIYFFRNHAINMLFLRKVEQSKSITMRNCSLLAPNAYKVSSIWKVMSEFLVMLCAIWGHLYNLKNVKSNHRGVLKPETCNCCWSLQLY